MPEIRGLKKGDFSKEICRFLKSPKWGCKADVNAAVLHSCRVWAVFVTIGCQRRDFDNFIKENEH